LLLQAQFLAYNLPKTVWRPGSARIRWGSAQAPPDPLAAKQGPTSKGRGREEGKGTGWEGKEGDRKGREGKEGRGKEGKGKRGGVREGRGKSTRKLPTSPEGYSHPTVCG